MPRGALGTHPQLSGFWAAAWGRSRAQLVPAVRMEGTRCRSGGGLPLHGPIPRNILTPAEMEQSLWAGRPSRAWWHQVSSGARGRAALRFLTVALRSPAPARRCNLPPPPNNQKPVLLKCQSEMSPALCLFPLLPFLFRRETLPLLQPPGLGWLLLRRAPRLSHPRARKRAACLPRPESWQAARKAPAAPQSEPSTRQPSVVPAPPSRGARLARCSVPSATSGLPARGRDLGFQAGFF